MPHALDERHSIIPTDAIYAALREIQPTSPSLPPPSPIKLTTGEALRQPSELERLSKGNPDADFTKEAKKCLVR